MRTETTDSNAKGRSARIAAENTTALTSPFVMHSTGKPDNELTSDDDAEDDSPPHRRRKRRRSNGKSGKGAAAKIKISAPVVVPSEYLTTQQAAAYLNLSRQYLEAARYRGDGSGPAYVKLERAVRYRRSVLDAWMSAHDHSPDRPIKSEEANA